MNNNIRITRVTKVGSRVAFMMLVSAVLAGSFVHNTYQRGYHQSKKKVSAMLDKISSGVPQGQFLTLRSFAMRTVVRPGWLSYTENGQATFYKDRSLLVIQAPVVLKKNIRSLGEFERLSRQMMINKSVRNPRLHDHGNNIYVLFYERQKLNGLRWDAEGQYIVYIDDKLIDASYKVVDFAQHSEDCLDCVFMVASLRPVEVLKKQKTVTNYQADEVPTEKQAFRSPL